MSEEVELRDGSRVVIRPVVPEDKDLLKAAWDRFGEESRYRRFMGPKSTLTASELAFYTEVDHVDHEALAAIDARTGEGVGVARYLRLPGRRDAAEVAVAVVDEWQHRGLGGELLRRLAARAEENGIRRFHASLFAFNRAMLALFEELGKVEIHRDGGAEIELDVDLPAESLPRALRAAASRQISARA